MTKQAPPAAPLRRAPAAKRRRARELALQALFALDYGKNPSGIVLFQLRERALIAEIEARFAGNQLADLSALVTALLTLSPRHTLGLEYAAALAKTGPTPLPHDAEDSYEYEALRGTDEELGFADSLVRGVVEHRDSIDATLARASTNWKLSRMTAVDRNLLRLGTFELAHLPTVPARVVLNEAIEISKRYGTADSSAFINGILDRVAALVRPSGAEAPPAKDATDPS